MNVGMHSRNPGEVCGYSKSLWLYNGEIQKTNKEGFKKVTKPPLASEAELQVSPTAVTRFL